MFNVGSLYKDLLPLGVMGTAGSEVPLVAIASDTTTVGAILDLHGFARALFVLLDKTLTDGDYQFQLFHGDASDMSDEAQVAASDLNGTLPNWDADTDDDQVVTVEYICRKRYARIKIVSTNFGSTGVDAIGGVVLKGQPGKMPQQT
jgi:hypothetical protein